MRGLAGRISQGMRAQKDTFLDWIGMYDASGGSATIPVPKSCTAIVYAWGGGGSGAKAAAGFGAASGGGGGGAVHGRYRLRRGQTISYSVGVGAPPATSGLGNPGGDTILSINGREVLRAGGGQGGAIGTTTIPGGAGGSAHGGLLVRVGGRGGAGVSSSSGGAGEAGPFGGAGGAGALVSGHGLGGGGGAAGFTDLSYNGLPLAGAGSNASSGGIPGTAAGGGGGAEFSPTPASAGAPGRILIVLVRNL